MGSRSRSRSRSPRRSRRRSRSPRRRSPRARSRSRSPTRSVSPSSLTTQPTILDSWSAVKKDPTNFDGWLRLMTLAESSVTTNINDQKPDLTLARNVFSRFLSRYPYCYGYWAKYADLERKAGNTFDCIKVFERGLTVIELSIDLWLQFLALFKEMATIDPQKGRKQVAGMFDKALSSAGFDFNSDRLWNEALAWHESLGDWKKVCELYDQLIQIPTAQHKTHYDRYMTIVNMYEPDILLTEKEYEDIFTRLQKHINIPIENLVTEEEIVQEQVAVNGEEAKPIVIYRKKHHPEALVFFREEIRDRRTRWHEKTAGMISTRFPFEEQIKRPYFHVKELETTQLKNWRLYLDYEISEGDEHRITVLFERCMIACALYDTMWLKYARWVHKKKGSSAARAIYKRATVHCPKSINLVIAHSALEESKGEYDEALSILNSFDRRNPGYAAIGMRKIGLARRKAAREKNPDYSDVIQQWEALIHSPGTSRHLSSFYSIKLARFHLKCRNDRRLASKVLRTALERDRDNIQLHLQLIDLAYTDPEFNQKKVLEAFDEALTARLEDVDRLRLSQRKLDFLEDVGDDIQTLQEHTEYHQQLVKEVENPHLQTRKRKSERDSYRDRDRDRGSRRDRDGGQFGGPPMYYQPQGMYDYSSNYAYGFY